MANWTGLGDGTSWSNPDNWSGDQLPGTNSAVQLNLTGSQTIVFSSGSTTVQSITGSDPLSITGGSLTVTSGAIRP